MRVAKLFISKQSLDFRSEQDPGSVKYPAMRILSAFPLVFLGSLEWTCLRLLSFRDRSDYLGFSVTSFAFFAIGKVSAVCLQLLHLTFVCFCLSIISANVFSCSVI